MKPEARIKADLTDYLEARGWLVKPMHGNVYQTGVPDLYCHHPKWGARWIDVKVEGRYSFTAAQRHEWPRWESYGVGIWILTGATQQDYDLLFVPPNWRDYWKPRWNIDVDALLAECV